MSDIRGDASLTRAAFSQSRQRLHDGMDALIDGVAALQTQIQNLKDVSSTAIRAIKEHVRDETEEFATAAIFVSLRIQQLWNTELNVRPSGYDPLDAANSSVSRSPDCFRAACAVVNCRSLLFCSPLCLQHAMQHLPAFASFRIHVMC